MTITLACGKYVELTEWQFAFESYDTFVNLCYLFGPCQSVCPTMLVAMDNGNSWFQITWNISIYSMPCANKKAPNWDASQQYYDFRMVLALIPMEHGSDWVQCLDPNAGEVEHIVHMSDTTSQVTCCCPVMNVLFMSIASTTLRYLEAEPSSGASSLCSFKVPFKGWREQWLQLSW